LFAAVLGFLVFPVQWRNVRARFLRWRTDGDIVRLIAWAAVVLAIPTVMQTKLPWYLNTFYPVFAVGVGLSLARGCRVAASRPRPLPRVLVFVAGLMLTLGVAESRLIWYSLHNRDLSLSRQSLVLADRNQLRGHRLYLQPFSPAGHFVAEAVVGAAPWSGGDYSSFLRESHAGDYILTSVECQAPELEMVRTNGRDFLCRRREADHDAEK
jgi:hypothetical protein